MTHSCELRSHHPPPTTRPIVSRHAITTDGDGFSGCLRNFSLLDVIQMVCVAQQTGRLEVQAGAKKARIFLVRGQIVHAETEGVVGEAALLEILCWKRGNFEWIGSPESPAARSIQASWEHVLMEAIRQRDEREYHHSGAVVEPGLPTVALTLGSGSCDLLAAAGLRRRRLQRRGRRSMSWRLLLVGALAVIVAGAGTIVIPPQLISTSWDRLRRELLDAVAPGWNWRPRELRDVLVPAGDFVFQDGQKAFTGAFRIDDTEITVRQYAAFLDQVGSRTDFDHPNQPRGKGHRSPEWDALRRAAFGFSKFHGRDVTPNTPAAFVDWFDAYAYARWRGRRLPTEEEWEKAGRGRDGWRFPWGNAPYPGAANIRVPEREITGPSEVATWKVDRSPYGVYDMAGNVSEWTASFDANGEPIVKGGNFESDRADLTRRILRLSPLTTDARIGFRTVADEGTGPAQRSPGL
ncbi:MAG: SUMF1/EgtB/PvdO family nonheme iron enzyme [Verrucomicrobia bacterium]|nr:SUMF1/EgtB/PvdO family nonheme iron enzyme [Verrucomicrobiota bacterium]